MSQTLRTLSLSLMLLSLAGCMTQTAPDRQALQDQQLPEIAKRQKWTQADGTEAVGSGWLTAFNDPRLNALIKEALEHNRNLQAGAARVEQAREMTTIDSAGLFPSLNFGLREGVKASNSTGDIVGWLLNVSWELDLWGRVRYQSNAAKAQAASAEADLHWARESLAAAVAKTWFGALQNHELVQLQGAWIKEQEALVGITEQRVRIGAMAKSDLYEAQFRLQQARDSLAQLQLANVQSIQALEILLGRYPDASLTVAGGLPALPSAPPKGIPTNLLERRPDLIAAEQRVATAFNRARSAEAARLPKLSLAAGLSSIRSDMFLLKDIDNPSLGGSISILAPIFNGGALKAQANIFSAQQKEASIAYGALAMQAIQEVEGSLAAEQSLAQRVLLLEGGMREQQRLREVDTVRVRIGSRDPRALHSRKQLLLSTQMNLTQTRGAQLAQRVSTVLALGGGWE